MNLYINLFLNNLTIFYYFSFFKAAKNFEALILLRHTTKSRRSLRL